MADAVLGCLKGKPKGTQPLGGFILRHTHVLKHIYVQVVRIQMCIALYRNIYIYKHICKDAFIYARTCHTHTSEAAMGMRVTCVLCTQHAGTASGSACDLYHAVQCWQPVTLLEFCQLRGSQPLLGARAQVRLKTPWQDKGPSFDAKAALVF